MRNIIICHGYAHRILANGIVESAPVQEIEGEFFIEDGFWQTRSAQEMDLTGGDIAYIRDTVSRLAHIFPTDERRVPVADGEASVPRNSTEPR